MKDKLTSAVRVILLLAGVAVAVYVLLFIVDILWNGSVADWFFNSFVREETITDALGQVYQVSSVLWYRLKTFLRDSLLLAVILGTLLILLIARRYARSQVRKSVSQATRMIHLYMSHDLDASDVFPRSYAELSAEMVQIKAEMERREQALKTESSRKNDLITYLAHDLKTPLTSVIGYLSLLEEAPDMPEEQKAKYVHIAREKADRLERLINEFFEITRYNLQQILLEKETFDLSYLLIQMKDEFYPLLSAHGNTAVLSSQEDLTLYGDPEKLARVFHNVLKNAIAYSYPGTPIEIRAERQDDHIVITFRNKGKTIPQQKLEAIFEKFFRLDEARTSNAGGAGLGLAIAKEIVSLHGGTITAESEQEVTTFRIALPLDA